MINSSTAAASIGFVEPPYPRGAIAWSATVILATLYFMSFVDQLVFSVLIEPLKLEFSLSDTQIGVLAGTSFAVFFVGFSLPLAFVADRFNRRNLIAVGAILWTATTALSAFAQNYEQLLLSRVGIGLGEAALGPAAMSIIADMFPRHKRVMPSSVYVGVGACGATAAILLSGIVLSWAATSAADILPLPADFEPWRTTLLAVGMLGFVLALLFIFVVREPARHEMPAPRESFWKPLLELRGHLHTLSGIYGYSALKAALSLALIIWFPTHLVRAYGMAPGEAGVAFGAVGLISTIVGGLTIPSLAARYTRVNRDDAVVNIAAISSVCMTPFLVASFLAPTATWSLLLLAPGFMLQIGQGIMVQATIPLLGSNRLRARLMAGYYLVCNVVGLGVGPLIIALGSDNIASGPNALSHSLAWMMALISPTLVIILVLTRRPFSRTIHYQRVLGR